MINRDVERYATLLRLVASLSRLFSDNDAPYVDSRFVERLFVQTTGAEDLGRKDVSFDARVHDIGIGVKTFLGGAGNSKREKIAEFTAYARDGRFNGLSKQELVQEVVRARNDRVISDAKELGIDVQKSIYHCLIRIPGGAIVHEEPYSTILEDALKPTNSAGEIVATWDEMGNGIYFTDGLSNYSYSTAKNVLMKQFIFDRRKGFVPIEILRDPLNGLENQIGQRLMSQSIETSEGTLSIANIHDRELGEINHEDLRPGIDYVVLPLYRLTGDGKEVPNKSGINQWNAAGRKRKFGEAYVPIPRIIHELFPNFFPERDVSFPLKLPNQAHSVAAKVCQDGSKALMTNPNHLLGDWLTGVVFPNIDIKQVETPSGNQKPVTYDDLAKIGKDSVRIVKKLSADQILYEAQFATVDSLSLIHI